MHVNSREYQCHLDPALFADPEAGCQRFGALLAGLHVAVQCSFEPQPATCFERRLYDTPAGDFAAANQKLRLRVYADSVKCAHKIASLDRYSIAEASFDCVDRAAKIKFEENIHAYHAMFVMQATSIQPQDRTFARVRDWARIFRSAALIADPNARLIAGPSLFIIRRRELRLNFKGLVSPALLDLKYADAAHTHLAKVEFSWKNRDPDEAYQADIVRLMRQFLKAVHHTPWVDLSIGLAKCQHDSR